MTKCQFKAREINKTVLVPDFTEQIERGAALLDKHVPGWEDRVEVDALALADGSQCILGQVFVKSLLSKEVLGEHGCEYTGGIDYLFTQDENERRSRGVFLRKSEDAVNRFSVQHGFLIEDTDVIDWVEHVEGKKITDSDGDVLMAHDDMFCERTHWLYECLTHDWVNFLIDRRLKRELDASIALIDESVPVPA